MQILFTVTSVNPACGGPIEVIKQLGILLMSQGHEVEVATVDTNDESFISEFPLPVHALGPARTSYAFGKLFLPWLKKNAANYDVVVINGIWQYQSFAVWLALRGSAVPYVIFPHGMLDPWFKNRYPLKHFKKCLYWPWAEYRVLRDASAVLFTAEEECRLARQSFWPYRVNEIVVSFGTARPSGNSSLQKARFLDAYPQLDGKRLALFMGRLHPKKGCDLAIQAFAEVFAKDSEWHLVMAGPDQIGWQTALENQVRALGISQAVTWTGMIKDDLKWGALHTAEIFLLPSHQENFGIAVAEALACGLPVLISNNVNIWREVANSCAGLVGQCNLSAFSSLLANWSHMTDLARHLMRENARKCFDQYFDIEEAGPSILRAIRSSARGRVSAPSRESGQGRGAC